MFRVSGENVDLTFDKELRNFMAGLKRHIAKKKIESGDKLDEGKKGMIFET